MLFSTLLSIFASATLSISGTQSVQCELNYRPASQTLEGTCNTHARIEVEADGQTNSFILNRKQGYRVIPIEGCYVTEVRIYAEG